MNPQPVSLADELRKALNNLLNKLDQVEKDTAGIFEMAHVHGSDYKGANWAEEYKKCRRLLAQHAAAEPPWKCKANPTADPPQDCDWPGCGCDPHANKVLEAIEESGFKIVPAAHAAEQPKLTELRAVLKKWDSFHGYTAGQLVSDIRALLTSPVAPPPRPLVPLDGGNWYYDAQRDIVMIDGRKYEPAVEEFRIAPPVAPGEPPPQPICKHGVAGCPECKTGIFATPPAQERASEEWWKAEALDVIRHARTNEPHDDWQDWSNAISGGLLRAYNRGVATAAKQAREGALEEAGQYFGNCGEAKYSGTVIGEILHGWSKLAAQPSPQTPQKER